MYEKIDENNPMIVTLDRFTKMRENFMSHYFLANCNPNFGGQEIQVPWNSFSLAIHNFMNSTEVAPKNTAMRLVHCYDAAQNVLYVRMQVLAMEPIQGEPRKFLLIEDPSAWYQLANGTIVPTTDTELYDNTYFDNFYYCNTPENCNPSTLAPLSDDADGTIYTRTVTVPWLEMRQLFADNRRPANATLCIDASCRLTQNDPECTFQHGLVCYLRKHDGTPMLDNDEAVRPFQNKAADFGTLCPDNCGVYILPKDRKPKDEEDAENGED
jgi:hypothetical protein